MAGNLDTFVARAELAPSADASADVPTNMSSANKEPLLTGVPRPGASVREATVNMMKICVGSGVMALPWGFLQGGALSLGGMVVIGLWNWWTSLQLVRCRHALANDPALWALGSVQGGVPRSAYSALAFAVLGRPGLILLEGSLLAVLTGVCASLQIQFAQFAASVLPHDGDGPASGGYYTACVLASAALLAPLVLQRTLSGLSRVSVAGLLVLVCGLAAVGIDGWQRYGDHWRLAKRLTTMPDLAGAAAFFGIAAFSFGTQAMILPVQEGMREPKRVGEALSIALVAVIALYVLVGAGLGQLYESAQGGVQQLIILNLTPGTAVALAVETCSAAVALLSYPLPLVPVVQLLLPACAGCAGIKPKRREDAVRLGLLGFTTCVALFVPSFGAMAGFLGCLNVTMAQLLPPLLHLKLISMRAWQQQHGDDPSLSLPSGGGQKWRRGVAVAVDALLLLLGVATLLFFSSLTGATLLGARL